MTVALRKADSVATLEQFVTPVSRVHDFTWDYQKIWKDNSVPPNRKILNWGFKISGAKRFTHPDFDELRRSAQKALEVIQKNKGVPLSPSSVAKMFTDFKLLLRYLVERHVSAFSSMTKGQALGYIAYVKESDLSPVRKFGRLRILGLIFEHRLQLKDPLSFNPFSSQSPFEILGNMGKELRSRKTPSIPDDVATALVKHAARMVSNAQPLIEAYLAREDASPSRGTSRPSLDRARREAAARAGFADGLVLTRSITLLRTACLILILFFTGVRKGEAASFKNVSLVKDKEGYLWLQGRKTKFNPGQARWMVPPIVAEAVAVAAEIARPLVYKLEQEEKWIRSQIKKIQASKRLDSYKARLEEIAEIKGSLFLCVGSKSSMSEFGNRISVLSNTYDCFRMFVMHTGLRWNGEPWKLACHQFRRTFARFMAANLVNLRYLQEHFKHLSLNMTAWYDTDDVEMTGLILEYYEEFKRDVLSGVMKSGVIAGKGASAFRAEREAKFLGLTSDKSKEQFIDSLSSVLNFKSTGISYCMGFRDKGLCSGVVGCMLDPRNVQACDNAFVPKEMLPAWQVMEKRCVAAIASNDLGNAEKIVQQDLLDKTIRPIIKELKRRPRNAGEKTR